MNYHRGVESVLDRGVGQDRRRGRGRGRSGYLGGDFNVVDVEAVDNVTGDGVA